MNEANSQQNSSKFSDIGEILGILRKRKNVIIWTTVICAVLTLFVSLFVITPKYSSSRIFWLTGKWIIQTAR